METWYANGTEVVFSWPGLGQLLIQAINGRDMAVVQATVFIVAFIVIVVNRKTARLSIGADWADCPTSTSS